MIRWPLNIMNELEKEIKIGYANPADAKGIQEVFYATWLDTYPNEEFNITIDDLKYRYRNSLSEETIEKKKKIIEEKSGDELYLVAKDDEKVVGVCYCEKEKDLNQLRAMYILPKYQGKGIGTRFWNETLNFFDSTKDVIVDVATYNKNAIEFYEKLGFTDTGERFSEERFRMRNGALLPEMRMVIKAK